MRKLSLSCAVTVLGVLLAALPASAQVNLAAGNNPQPNEANVLLQNGSSGATVTGTTNTNPSFDVVFSNEKPSNSFKVNANNNGGQAKIFDIGSTGPSDQDHLIQGFTISIPDTDGFVWNDLIFDAHVDGLSTPRHLDVTGTTTLGGAFTFNDATSGKLGPGNNFFTLTSGATTGGFTSVTLFSSEGILDYEQIRVSFGPGVTVTPEGSSLALLLPGLIPLGFFLRRRRSNKA
jgi:hypothetical protein